MNTPTPIDQMTDEQKLQELREITEMEKKQRARKLELVRQLFPDSPPRGRLKEVSEATKWTREHVANIRDGKVTE